ncbi:hypothetical protein [Bacillus cereus group sp. N21]|uniref:hypothetical protein n=1 Tax=Bacillus cereus group sp. N21 TaxID=2794591 RepID=UPI0018F59882|nr:hypothetical protein [Bacillus cereus group sp. N21]MBJ8027260.1 hypothetical protein [Bacillus cereus group sp. N21]
MMQMLACEVIDLAWFISFEHGQEKLNEEFVKGYDYHLHRHIESHFGSYIELKKTMGLN